MRPSLRGIPKALFPKALWVDSARKPTILSQVIHSPVDALPCSAGKMGGMDTVEGLLYAPVATSFGLYLLMVGGFLRAMRRRNPTPQLQTTPRVSILQPLAGIADELDQNLSLLAELRYLD